MSGWRLCRLLENLLRPVTAPAHHCCPDDAGGLVGECDPASLVGLRLEAFEPTRIAGWSITGMAQHRNGAGREQGADVFVAANGRASASACSGIAGTGSRSRPQGKGMGCRCDARFAVLRYLEWLRSISLISPIPPKLRHIERLIRIARAKSVMNGPVFDDRLTPMPSA